ncbi:hypothetical protein ENBRE01_2019 [Enteropsectra breve]|nr:hypothetical protein ENBRE01_2019 [Enteropsectra breve]
MIVVHLLITYLLAAEQAADTDIQPEGKKVNFNKEYEKNTKAIKNAKNKNLTKVKIPGVMRTRKQFYNESELRKFLEQEKNAQPLEDKCIKEKNDKVAEQCVICTQSLFFDQNEGNLFKQRVFKTHGYKILCVMCPNPNNCGGRMCCSCAREWISVRTETLSSEIPRVYFDKKNIPISNKRMVECPICKNYLNIEPLELETIPEDVEFSTQEKINYIEDVVADQDKKYWFLETIEIRTCETPLATRHLSTVRDVGGSISKDLWRDSDQMLLLNDLRAQHGFFTSCTSRKYNLFSDRAKLIKEFIKNCTEKLNISYLVRNLREIIIESDISFIDLEAHYRDICSTIPIEHADKFDDIYCAMIKGYFEKTKNYNMNLQFMKRWILSKNSFILTGFVYDGSVSDEESEYYPRAADLYTAFANALHDPRLIDNIINCNALEFTFKGLSYYPKRDSAAYEKLITNLTEKYYKKLLEENNYGMYKDIFVGRHGADVRRFSYTVYKKILTEELGHSIKSINFNSPYSGTNMVEPPAFIYDAILKVLLTMAPAHYDDAVKKITDIAITKSSLFKCDKNYADFLRETTKAKSCANTTAMLNTLAFCRQDDIPSVILLFKNLPASPEIEYGIGLFEAVKRVPELIEGIKNFEFVDWENETPILKMLKEHKPELVETMLKRMSMQPSCYFEVPSEDIDSYIIKYYNDIHNYKRLGSVAFVCRNTELLKSFRDDLNEILTNWDFALNLHQLYNGVISPEGIKAIADLPFFRMYYTELFEWLDTNISNDDKALKLSRMLMVAKLAARDLTVRMEVDNMEVEASSKDTDTSSIAPVFELEKDMLLAVWNTKVGYEAFCAFQCYLSTNFKNYLEEKVLSEIVAIEGADSTEVLMESKYRGYYRKLLVLQKGLDMEEGMISCSEEEMRKLLEMLSVLKKIEELDALNNIKQKSEIKEISTDIKYYTDNIKVLPKRACKIAQMSFRNASQNNSPRRKRPFIRDV